MWLRFACVSDVPSVRIVYIDLYCIICIRVILLTNAAFRSYLCVQWSEAIAPSYQDYRFAEGISTWEDGVEKVENFLTLFKRKFTRLTVTNDNVS